MRMGFRRFGRFAAVAVCLVAVVAGRRAHAAVMSFTDTVVFTTPVLATPTAPLQLNFSFPGLLVNVQSIAISGTFAPGGGWDYFDRFAFSLSATGPTGLVYEYWGNTPPILSYGVSLYPAPDVTSSSLQTHVAIQVPTGGTDAFKSDILAQLATTGTLNLYFLPQPQQVYGTPSQFLVQSATALVVGEDPPADAPIPAGGLLFFSGAALVWFSGRRGKSKS